MKSYWCKKVAFLILLLNSFSCFTKKQGEPLCKLKEIKTLFFYGTPDSVLGNNYTHYILFKEFSRSCIDSTTIVNAILYYMDTIKNGKPIGVIKVFNSDKDFIPNSISQDMEKINKSCLVTVNFDIKTKHFTDFLFYNDRGNIIYWGKKWVPFPQGNDIFKISPNIK